MLHFVAFILNIHFFLINVDKQSKKLMESQRLHEAASGFAEDENLSEQLTEMVLSCVSSLMVSKLAIIL